MVALSTALAVVLVTLVGWAACRRALARLRERRDFALAYVERWAAYSASTGRDREAYTFLTLHSARMQRELGAGGVLAVYRPPAAGVVFRDVPVLLNLLPQLDSYIRDDVLVRSVAPQLADVLRDVLVRHQGSVAEAEAEAEERARNPLGWFAAGIRAVVSTPVRALVAFGLLSPARRDRALASRPFSLASGVAALVGFVAAVVGLLSDWEGAVRFLRSLR